MKLNVFAFEAPLDPGQAVAEALNQPLTPLEEREFQDSEPMARLHAAAGVAIAVRTAQKA